MPKGCVPTRYLRHSRAGGNPASCALDWIPACAGTTCALDSRLGFYKEVDIALDTYPYNGTTTLCEGLWMGVPPVSMCGPVPASRVGASLLHSLGMVDWVAETPEEFVAIAKSKSQDIDGLAALRMGLRERFSQSTLGSPERFALEFESALAEAYAVAWASEPVRG